MIVALVYVLFFGDVRGGARRWIDFGVFNLQPSEFTKLALALVLAKFVGENRRGGISRMDLIQKKGKSFVKEMEPGSSDE